MYNVVNRINDYILNYSVANEKIPKFLILDAETYRRFKNEYNKENHIHSNTNITSYKGLKVCVLKEKIYNFIKCA